MEKLQTLCDIYKSNKKKKESNSNNSKIISFDDRWFDSYLVSLSLMKVDNNYNIYLYIEKNKKIILKALLESSDKLIKKSYNEIRGNLQVLDFNSFIDRYYNILLNNFS